MRKLIAFIPNLLTLSNLASGCMAVVSAANRNFEIAAWMVVLAAVFDFFDGFAARKLDVSGPMGKELDSLADVVSFGVAPAMVMYTALCTMSEADAAAGAELYAFTPWWTYAAFLIALCSAFRLAKFNLDERQAEEFRGLPTPACALFFSAFPSVAAGCFPVWGFVAAIVAMSALLVSDIPMFSLKFKRFGFRENALRYVFLALALGLLIGFRMQAFTWIVGLYIIISATRAIFIKKTVSY